MYKQFGVREICNVVFKAKSDKQKIGNKTFDKYAPVIYFDSLKTSSIEGASTTVYAQGGRGNPRLIAWEGERTVTFTMEDALISPMGFAILSGAGLVSNDTKTMPTHVTERVIVAKGQTTGEISYLPSKDYAFYAMQMDGDTVVDSKSRTVDGTSKTVTLLDKANEEADTAVLVDYYVAVATNMTQIDIEPDKFGGNFYIEAETLFRDKDGKDHAAEFIIPNGKVQSNFTFTMASSGDPSTFTFTVDAFPGYTMYDQSKKVMAVLQIADGEIETAQAGTPTNLED